MKNLAKRIIDGKTAIVDTANDVVIYATTDMVHAERLYRKLKNGSGFQSWTPMFMSEKGVRFSE